MGNYLLDSSGDMIWNCPHQAAPLGSPIVDEGFVGVGKKDRGPISLDQHLSPALSIPPRIGAKKSGLGSKFDAEESYSRGVYSSALTGEGPYVTGKIIQNL